MTAVVTTVETPAPSQIDGILPPGWLPTIKSVRQGYPQIARMTRTPRTSGALDVRGVRLQPDRHRRSCSLQARLKADPTYSPIRNAL